MIKFKKLISASILILSLTASWSGFTQERDFEWIADDARYTMYRWRAVMLIEDAYTKRLQDTLIDSLNSRIKILEDDRKAVHDSFNQEVSVLNEKFIKQVELTGLESSLKESYKADANRFRRQRNWLIGGVSAVAAYGIFRVFVPP